MLQIGLEGLGHYVHSNCEETLVILVRIQMKEEIKFDSMQRALELTALRYKLLRCSLASEGKGLFYQESARMPALQKEDRKYHLGSAELSHFPYRVSCKGKSLTISIHHGLTDGYGATEFVKTLLYYYLCEIGKTVLDEGKIRLNEIPFAEEDEDELSYLKYFDAAMEPHPPEVGQIVPFSLPVTYWDEEGKYIYKRFKISLSAGEILDMAHRTGSSATAAIDALICKSFLDAYDLTGKPLISSITSNFRYLLPSKTIQNFSGYIVSFYTPDMHDMSLEETAVSRKAIIQMSNTKENALRLINQRYNAGMKYREMPVEQMCGDQTPAIQERREVRQRLGYLLTNVGKLSITKSMEEWVEDMELYIPAKTSPMVFGMNAVGDRMTLSVSQSFEDDTLSRSFVKVCSGYGLTVASRDMGTEEHDTLGIDAVERL